jgi:hypothetical protein
VRKTLEFAKPERVARQLWLLPWAQERYPEQLEALRGRYPDDIAGPPAIYRCPPVTQGNAYVAGIYVDEWGCSFEGKQSGYIGEVKEALVNTWDDLDKVRPPVEMFDFDVDQVNAFCRETDQFIIAGCCPRPFERLQFIRKSDNLYLDLAEQSSEIYELLRRVHNFYLQEMERWAETEVDALMFMDDWGAQRSLLISPRLWRKMFKPLYKEYIDLAHSHGKYIFMHSDGYIADIIPDLVELGLDALNSQLFVMDIEELGRQFRGKITFWGEIDRQHLLPYGAPADIQRAVKRVKEALYQDGGAIAQCEFGPGARPENVMQVFKTWQDLV